MSTRQLNHKETENLGNFGLEDGSVQCCECKVPLAVPVAHAKPVVAVEPVALAKPLYKPYSALGADYSDVAYAPAPIVEHPHLTQASIGAPAHFQEYDVYDEAGSYLGLLGSNGQYTAAASAPHEAYSQYDGYY
ncbi:hypothetical protein FOCC_FOCC015444 [Frankliniella occidentalis]|nr:hypothetical protein FOCC_FOCC015444 [Frankliniella occidentalis]